MAEDWYSRRNIKKQFKKLSILAWDSYFPGSEPGVAIWIAFCAVGKMTFWFVLYVMNLFE